MQRRSTGLATGLVALGLTVSLGIRFDVAAHHDERTNPFPHHSRPQERANGPGPARSLRAGPPRDDHHGPAGSRPRDVPRAGIEEHGDPGPVDGPMPAWRVPGLVRP